MDHAYVYRPLRDTEIRLLTINPLENGHGDNIPIHCTLKHVQLLPASPDRSWCKGSNRNWPEAYLPYDHASLFKDTSASNNTPSLRVPGNPLSDTVQQSITFEDGSPWKHSWGDYVALSYVWGSPATSSHIMLDNALFLVGINLYDALLHLRRCERIRQGFKVWVDAICINQSDVLERGQQVTRMRDIYASAWQVVIWLGSPESKDGDAAFTAMHWIAERSRQPNPLKDFYRERVKIDARPLFIIWADYRSPLRKTVYNSLFSLLKRPYWQRMWILQEVAMARDDAPVLYGDRCLPWRDLHDAAVLISTDEQRFGRDIVGSARPRIPVRWSFEIARDRLVEERDWASERMWDMLRKLMLLQRSQASRPEEESVSSTLQPLLLARDAKVTEERDRVYGILGMRSVADKVSIMPDYLLSLSTIYQDFSMQLLLADVNILRLISHGAGIVYDSWNIEDVPPAARGYPFVTPVLGMFLKTVRNPQRKLLVGVDCTHDLPSWTICWTCKPAPIVQLRGTYQAGRTTAAAVPLFEGRCLTVQGRIIDKIVSLSSFHASETNTRYPQSMPNQQRNAYGDREGAREALWRTLVANTTVDGGAAPSDYCFLLDARLWSQGVAGLYANGFSLDEFMTRNKRLELCGQELRHLIFAPSRSQWWQNTERFYNPSTQQLEMLSWGMNVLAWRRLVGTQKGRIGLAPGAARLGDCIAVIAGCSVPMVLRQKRDGWKIVGECYVHGVMDGKVFVDEDGPPVPLKLY
ncbi:hypothetical protein LTR97_006523 [Elasticomyces elasticus]|uniref:Heterokaryon incompatibility domain-containing protein n=1 Tax=Elasticomyces elasticus TaxID=574655 RepID=A0AAN7ZN89_9PEZI|nr:hypothetical protein LTR97_006523 [Elasticomyces elasticus]